MKLVVLFLVGCAIQAGAAQPLCRPVPGSEAVLTKDARAVLGEKHGNHETQRFVANVACLAELEGTLRVDAGRCLRRDVLDGCTDGRRACSMKGTWTKLALAGSSASRSGRR